MNTLSHAFLIRDFWNLFMWKGKLETTVCIMSVAYTVLSRLGLFNQVVNMRSTVPGTLSAFLSRLRPS